MSRTFRSDEFGHKIHDGLRREKRMKRASRYTGWLDDGIRNRKTGAWNKKRVNKYNCRIEIPDDNWS